MSYDVWISTEEQERYEKILSAFTEVAGVASGCAESCNMVLDWIKNTLKTLPEKVSSETNQPTAIGQGGRNINVENTTNIFDLVVTRKKVVHLTKGKRTNFKRGKQKKKKVVPSSISVKVISCIRLI